MDNSLLSPELRAELGQGDIVITKKRKKVPNAKKGPKPQAPSKARVKKMQKIKERKMNKLRQREYLDTIQKESVPAVSRTLLHSTCNMGQKATLRERLMREHLEKKAGIFTGKDEFIHNPIQHMHQLHTVTPDMTIEEVNEYQTQKQAQALVARKKKRSRATDFFHNQDDALVEMQKQSNKNKKNEKTDEKTKSVVVSNDKASSTPLQPAKRIVKMKVNILQKPTSEEDSNPPAANPYKISFKVVFYLINNHYYTSLNLLDLIYMIIIFLIGHNARTGSEKTQNPRWASSDHKFYRSGTSCYKLESGEICCTK